MNGSLPEKSEPLADACYLGGDIGAYNTCGHLCRYCYANYGADTVRKNMTAHDPESPLLIGRLTPEDRVHEAKQESWIARRLRCPSAGESGLAGMSGSFRFPMKSVFQPTVLLYAKNG